MDESNWRPRLDAVERCLNSCRARSLSFSGKALIINALALSRVWYVATQVPMPPWVLTKLTSLVFNFFWSGKRDLVARRVLHHLGFVTALMQLLLRFFLSLVFIHLPVCRLFTPLYFRRGLLWGALLFPQI